MTGTGGLDWQWIVIGVVGAAAVGALAAALLTGGVYKHIIALKYLFGGWKAIVPIVSAAPAALGVFLLILVFAIMDGFVAETRQMTRGTLADIIVDAELSGIPEYEALVKRIEALPEVDLATPVIQTYGVVRFQPPGYGPIVRTCQVMGIRPEDKVRMGRFREYLIRQNPERDPRDLGLFEPALFLDRNDPATDLLKPPAAIAAMREARGLPDRPGAIVGLALVGAGLDTQELRQLPAALTLRASFWVAAGVGVVAWLFVWRAARQRRTRRAWQWAKLAVGAVAIGLVITAASLHAAYRGQTEVVAIQATVDRPLLAIGDDLVVSTIPIKPSGAFDVDVGGLPRARSKGLTVVDYFKSGYWEADSSHLYMDFRDAQELAGLGAISDEGVPARASEIHVKLAPGASAAEAIPAIQAAWSALVLEAGIDRPPRVSVETWEAKQRMILGVVEMERNITALMLGAMFIGFAILTSLISYVMAYIKSRDIGIMKALGAADAGVGSLFLGYGFVIGLIGAALGVAASLLMLHYLDPIEAWVSSLSGVEVFSRKVYYFDRIPRTLSPLWITTVSLSVLVLSTVASAAGGLLAALKNPVETLRYE